jgi:hypothetical protein
MSIRGNYFSDNGFAVDLETSLEVGPTPNDPEDVDAGPNNLLNFPKLLTSSPDAAGNWKVVYDIDADDEGFHFVEFYRYTIATETYEPLYGTILESTTTTEPGKERFQAVIPASVGLAAGHVIVATLTVLTGGNTGSTSEFSTPLTLKIEPPRVIDVIVSRTGSNPWGRPPVSFAQNVSAGKQLAPIYTEGANTIYIAFSEDVILDGSELTLYGSNDTPISTSNFDYDETAHIAIWNFTATSPNEKYRLELTTAVEDISGNALDGEWVNDANGTPDDFGDDPMGRTFLSRGGVAGSPNNCFEFFFSILPGDYDQNGVVNSADLQPGTIKDGNGDGTIDSGSSGADYQLAANVPYAESFLPFRKNMGDYKDNEIVDGYDGTNGTLLGNDYGEWRLTYGDTVPSDPQNADGNLNGVVDTADYVVWRSNATSWSTWYTGPIPGSAGGSGGPYVEIGEAPRVTNFVISGSESLHAPFSFASVDGSGEQLCTVPVGGADTISITFSEDVNVMATNLSIVSLRTAKTPTLVEFTYDIATMTATWRFEASTFGNQNGYGVGDHFVINLSDAVTDIEGDRLDGEWVNPASLSTTASSTFPSGDGEPGGNFVFAFTLLAGDANRDLLVNNADWTIISANLYGPAGKIFTQGDFSGDGFVTSTDINHYSSVNQFNLQAIWMLADLNGDFAVDDDDLQTISDNYGMSGATHADGDLNGDGWVSAADIELAFAQYGLGLEVVS